MKKVFFRIITALIGALFSILILEIGLRLYPKFGYRYSSFQNQHPFLEVLNMSDQRYLYRPSSLFGYEHIPNNKPYTNRYGLLGKEYKLKKDDDVYRILILGDSIAEQRWSADFLEEDLNRDKYLSGMHRFEIWNAGVSSYDVRRHALFLKYRGATYNPDMVIIFLFMNDFNSDNNIYYKTKNGIACYNFHLEELHKKSFRVNPFLMQYSCAYRYAILKLSTCLLQKEKSNGVNKSENDGRYYLGEIKNICKKRKISLYVVVFPYLKNFDEYQPYQKEQYFSIMKVLKEINLDYIDLYSMYDKLIRQNFNIREKEEDEIHPSKEAHRLIAVEIYQYLRSKLIGRSSHYGL